MAENFSMSEQQEEGSNLLPPDFQSAQRGLQELLKSSNSPFIEENLFFANPENNTIEEFKGKTECEITSSIADRPSFEELQDIEPKFENSKELRTKKKIGFSQINLIRKQERKTKRKMPARVKQQRFRSIHDIRELAAAASILVVLGGESRFWD